MDKQQSFVIFAILSSLLIVMVSQTYVSAAPSYSPSDYDNLRDLYELIMQKELLADAYGPSNHRMVRKNSRSPSLRLRFGRRSDPTFYQGPSSEEHQYQNLPDVATSEN